MRDVPNAEMVACQLADIQKAQSQSITLRPIAFLIGISVFDQCIQHAENRAGRHVRFLCNVKQAHASAAVCKNLNNA